VVGVHGEFFPSMAHGAAMHTCKHLAESTATAGQVAAARRWPPWCRASRLLHPTAPTRRGASSSARSRRCATASCAEGGPEASTAAPTCTPLPQRHRRSPLKPLAPQLGGAHLRRGSAAEPCPARPGPARPVPVQRRGSAPVQGCAAAFLPADRCCCRRRRRICWAAQLITGAVLHLAAQGPGWTRTCWCS
jgi:hypothetical protein